MTLDPQEADLLCLLACTANLQMRRVSTRLTDARLRCLSPTEQSTDSVIRASCIHARSHTAGSPSWLHPCHTEEADLFHVLVRVCASCATCPMPLLTVPICLSHRTFDPEEADFFYVPIYTSCYSHPIHGYLDGPWWYGPQSERLLRLTEPYDSRDVSHAALHNPPAGVHVGSMVTLACTIRGYWLAE